MTTTYRRASDLIEGIGANLDSIQDKDVLLKGFTIQERNMPNETRTLLMLEIAPDVTKPDETKWYHAWSDSLANKLAEIPSDALPVIIKFTRMTTKSGFRVWSFE
jgi:hypothetical protein